MKVTSFSSLVPSQAWLHNLLTLWTPGPGY